MVALPGARSFGAASPAARSQRPSQVAPPVPAGLPEVTSQTLWAIHPRMRVATGPSPAPGPAGGALGAAGTGVRWH